MDSKLQQQEGWQNLKDVIKTTADMSLTNEEFFKQGSCMYFTDEVQLQEIEDKRFVNEF